MKANYIKVSSNQCILTVFYLLTGAAWLEIGFVEGTYTGEFNKENEAHGEGTFINQFGFTYSGTFVSNKRDGHC